MSDETSEIIGWPIGQQYRERAALNEASTTTWETLVEQYRERAVRDGARIDELRQSTEHWHDTAQMLKRQRDTAEEDRDGWKIRAMQSEQQRQALRAECDALRKDAAAIAALREPISEGVDKGWSLLQTRCFESDPGMLDSVKYDDFQDALNAAIKAALAVQP